MITATSSGRKTANAQITNRPSLLTALVFDPAATLPATVTIYDGTSNAGTELLHLDTVNLTTSEAVVVAFNHPVEAKTGLYAEVSGTGCAYIVHFSLL